MSPANNNNTMRSLYNMALACCDHQALRSNLLRFEIQASPARMQMLINLAMKNNKFFRNYVTNNDGS